MNNWGGCERCTDFSSRFTRRYYGGPVRRYFYSPSFLSAVFMAEWRNVLGKSRCFEEKDKPIFIRDVDKALYYVLDIKHSITPTCLTYASNDVIMLSKYDCFNGKEV